MTGLLFHVLFIYFHPWQVKQIRLPVPCPVPTSFTRDVMDAINTDRLKGIMKTRLLRQGSVFYWGLCPRPTQSEYNEMSTALCDRFPQLKDKRPVNGRYWVCEKIHKYYMYV